MERFRHIGVDGKVVGVIPVETRPRRDVLIEDEVLRKKRIQLGARVIADQVFVQAEAVCAVNLQARLDDGHALPVPFIPDRMRRAPVDLDEPRRVAEGADLLESKIGLDGRLVLVGEIPRHTALVVEDPAVVMRMPRHAEPVLPAQPVGRRHVSVGP